MKEKKQKVGSRNWFIFIFVGFAGQLAWSLENMYLNNFIFDQGYNAYQSMITLTVALSAITACLTTIIMGGLSDKIGRRKSFICGGYILWGLSTAAFGLINKTNVANLFPLVNSAYLASIFIIILDCLMTFFGSSANDAAFNSYVTRNVIKNNRGKVEGVLSILPLMSMLLITLIFSFTVEKNNWSLFFYIIGGFVFIIGIFAIFIIPKEKVEKSKDKYFSLVFEGFKPSIIRENKTLYLIFLADFIYCAASQIFFPYMMIYFQNTLEINGNIFMIFMVIVLVLGSILAVIGSRLMDKISKLKMLLPWSIIYILGLVLLYFVKKDEIIFATISGVIMMFGYIIVSTNINALIRDFTPKGKEGSFQGIRMIFQVALPMITGPIIGQIIVEKLSNGTFKNSFGELQKLPPNYIFIFAALLMILIIIPIVFLLVLEKRIHRFDNKGILYEKDKTN